jgi:hypothetical protein
MKMRFEVYLSRYETIRGLYIMSVCLFVWVS